MAKNYSLDELRDIASTRDVSFDLNRLYRQKFIDGDPEVTEIMKTGHRSEAINSLLTTTPEAMEYGLATREERIARASEFAAKAGIALGVLAEEHGLTELL